MNRRRLIRSLLLAVASASIAVGVQAARFDEGAAAPALQATFLDGTAFSLANEKGKVVLVNFWATWCAPCRAEMPALDAYYRRHRDEGLIVVAVSMDAAKDEPKVREVMREFQFPAATAGKTDFSGYARIWRLPLTFVVDRTGVLRKKDWFGDPGIDEAALEQTVTPLLRAR